MALTTPVQIGKYVPESGATAAIDCLVGIYQDLEGQIFCKPAPAGSFVDLTGAAEATLCFCGRYQPNSGQISCILAGGSLAD